MKYTFINSRKGYATAQIKRRSLGQGMTEYIIIVALIAIASIAAVSYFGQSVQGAFGGMASVLGGGSAAEGRAAATAAGKNAIAESTGAAKSLANYDQ